MPTKYLFRKRKPSPTRELNKLLAVVSRLRAPNGCPWDREQTHATLARYLLEEAHEAYDVMERDGDDADLMNELGDVLLQVVLHCQIATERNAFRMADVCKHLRKKMIERHTHVFGSEHRATPAEVEASWEARKSPDREGGRLGGIPRTLPALVRAERTQDRAASIGFDWDDISGVVEKIAEEAKEMAAAQANQDMENIAEELGDLLFSLVNLARYLKLSPERQLHNTIDKFAARFAYMERKAQKAGRTLSSYTLAELDEFWNQAKILADD